MTESFIGILISAMAISSLMLAVQSIESSYRKAGKNSLSTEEINIINSAGLNTNSNLKLLESDIENLPQKY